jgi:hypothetical protein
LEISGCENRPPGLDPACPLPPLPFLHLKLEDASSRGPGLSLSSTAASLLSSVSRCSPAKTHVQWRGKLLELRRTPARPADLSLPLLVVTATNFRGEWARRCRKLLEHLLYLGVVFFSLSSLKHGQSPFGVQLLYHLVSVSMFLLNSSSSLFAL